MEEVKIPKPAPSWNIKTSEFDKDMEDPYRDNKKKLKFDNPQLAFYFPVIVRHIQDDKPKKCVKVLRIPKMVVSLLYEITQEDNEGNPLWDADKGHDFKLRFDNKKPVAEKYRVTLTKEQTKLTDKERSLEQPDIYKALKQLRDHEDLQMAEQEVDKIIDSYDEPVKQKKDKDKDGKKKKDKKKNKNKNKD